MEDVTKLLNPIDSGDKAATDELIPLVYQELRQMAARKMAHEREGQTIQATALVHEAYLRLVGDGSMRWNSRAHFFSAAAEAMRRILIDRARMKQRNKHGGSLQRVSLDEIKEAIEVDDDHLIVVNEALMRLETVDPECAEIVKLRFFAGLTLRDIARLQGMSERTAGRIWAYGRSWLGKEIQAAQ